MEKDLLRLLNNKEKLSLLADNGLFRGKMGISLSYYLINKKHNDSELLSIADELLIQVVDSLSKKKYNNDFDTGLSGIGTAICLLSKEGCVDGDVDSMLFEIDASIYKELNNNRNTLPFDVCKGLIGHLIYITTRLSCVSTTDELQRDLNLSSLRILLGKIEEAFPNVIPEISKDLYVTSLWPFPILFIMLRKIMDLSVCDQKIADMIGMWAGYISSFLPYSHTYKLYLAVSIEYLNIKLGNQKLTEYVRTLLASVNLQDLVEEIDFRIVNVNEGCFFHISVLSAAQSLFPMWSETHLLSDYRKELIDRINKQIITSSQNVKDLTFINGLAGIGCQKTIWPNLLSY